MTNSYVIGTSAIATAQKALDLIGQNVANATTPGYHRVDPQLVSRTTGPNVTGVDIGSVTRYSLPAVRTAILTSNGDQGRYTALLDTNRQVETALATSQGGVGDKLESFFNQVEELTARPDNLASRRTILTAASDLSNQLNSTAGDIDRLRSDLGRKIGATVDQVNTLATRIASLNTQILTKENRGLTANDLRDQRDVAIDDLSKLIDVKTVEVPSGQINVISGDSAVVVGEFANRFTVSQNASDDIVITDTTAALTRNFRSGSLAGDVQSFNTDIPALRARLDTLAGQLIQKVNQVQATGLGSTPITSLSGTNQASSVTAPLNAAGLPFAVQAGTLTVSVTNNNVSPATRTNTAIAINPATQSLTDIATALSAVPGLAATVNATSNTLNIQAQAGYSFEFAGRDSLPAGSGAVANTDTSGLLVALGVNGLFVGSSAASIRVNPAITADPTLLAASRTGQVGDGTNLERLGAVRDAQAVGTRTLTQDFADIAATLGSDINSFNDLQTTQASALRELASQEQATTGVDTNEELVKLLAFQRMIQGASKYLSVVNTSMDALFNII
ncbi:flagellar hook-associated protein FlgK [Gemmata sp. JC717]|uniref:Flagellar hook-associated protein 1 n=1 Tax=Gemmata algarum TaxID=2975278 RepID=A0ABU5ERA9_9BACT|nr:flagellar hook-associated protein FlgK [Gemmata algarum]MDY3556839.1 flagellar hook-associated protein FlgK [Gemmata algarum]MDY3557871.1 flagellar hook-associated protein FlgK [Gemmata algarum]